MIINFNSPDYRPDKEEKVGTVFIEKPIYDVTAVLHAGGRVIGEKVFDVSGTVRMFSETDGRSSNFDFEDDGIAEVNAIFDINLEQLIYERAWED